VPVRTVLLDTSFVVAFENKDDPHHHRAKELDGELLAEGATLLFHWGILLEIGDGYARLGRRAKGQKLLTALGEEESYREEPITDPLLRQALDTYRNRPDKEWGLTDCVSFALMARESVREALTADVHFRQAGFVALLLE
jgi:predicted nucleic acid-binding protein